MIRLLFLAHRYLGIAVGALMAMWCLSGLVMMYVSYPAMDQRARLAHLAPIDWRGCCKLSADALADSDAVGTFRIEMLAGRPVMQLGMARDAVGLIDLTSGLPMGQVSQAQAAGVAAAYLPAATAGRPRSHPQSDVGSGSAGSYAGGAAPGLRLQGLIDYDQWTLEGVSPGDRPLYHFSLDDSQHTELYVSSSSGRAVQLTTRAERFWNWLGSVPHWLYFADLRHRAVLWSQVVIYTSLLGCFLTAIGLYIGVRQVVRRPAGRWSPYRGFNLWHHMAGLFFGLFTLTWVLSGLLSMNPWGLLEGGGARAERARLRGPEPTGAQVRTTLQNLAAVRPLGVVSIQSAPLHGQLFLIASSADGVRRRLDASGTAAPLDGPQLAFIASALSGNPAPSRAGAATGPLQRMTRGDDYYFSHHSSPVQFPVYRLLVTGGVGGSLRYYIDPVSGMLLGKIDAGSRGYRWWHEALHRMDFAALIRGRPQWDVLMWLLMLGVTTVCVTGTYLGYRRLTR